MTRRIDDRFTGSQPDEPAAVALAARAARHLAKFHEWSAASRMHDTNGLLEWAAVPSAAEILTSYGTLLHRAAGGAAETAAACWARLLLVEEIVVDAGHQRQPVVESELRAAAQMIRIMREDAEIVVEETLAGERRPGGGGERPEFPGALPPTGCDGSGDRAPAAPVPTPTAPTPQTLLGMIGRWREVASSVSRPLRVFEDAAGRKRQLEEMASLETRIATTPARGDADLIAKAKYAKGIIVQNTSGSARLTDVDRLMIVMIADIERICGGDQC